MLRSWPSSFAFFCFVTAFSHASSVQFSPRTDIQTHFQHLNGIAIADFNGDGKLDIAVTDELANTVTVYLNNGAGVFGTPVVTTLPAGGYVGLESLVSGDVNEDGKQDLIVGPIGGNQYDIVLLGNGDGTFTPGQTLKTTYGIINGSLVDVNGDKHLDLVSGANPELDIELGDGKGNFTQKPLPPGYDPSTFNTGLTVGDFTGDGHPDFLSIAYNSRQLQFYRGVGDGSFDPPTILTPKYLALDGVNLTSADFNGDGKLDLLLGENYATALYFGNGDGTFQTSDAQTVSIPLPNYTPSNSNVSVLLSAADFDGNGTTDVVAADDNAQLVSVLLNDGTGTFPQTMADFSAGIDAGTAAIRVADLNGDGLPDIVLTNYKTQNISIFLSIVPKTTPTVSLQSSATQALVGSSITITVQVKGASSQIPTGTVTLASGSTSYGQQSLSATGQATFTLSNLPSGQYPLTASYSGDRYNNSTTIDTGTSPGTIQSVTDFQVTLPTATQSVAVGGSATYSVGLTPLSGFSGAVTLTCSGLPAGFSCAPTSSTVSEQATSVSLVVSPPATTASLTPGAHDVPKTAFALFGLAWLCFGIRKRRNAPMLVLFGFALLSAGALSGCGGSSSPPKPTPYTGTSSFTITATTTQGSTTVSHGATATLTVHQ